MRTSADSYAYRIVHSMLRLQEGERLNVTAGPETIAFAHKVAHEAADSSGVPASLVYVENGRVESADEIAPTSGSPRDPEGEVMLHLAAFTPSTFKEEDELDAIHLQAHRLLADPVFLDRRISIPWAVAYVPTATWAEFVHGPGATVDRLYLDLAEALTLDEEDDHSATLEKVLSMRAEKLSSLHLRKIRLESPMVTLEADVARGASIGTSAVRLPSGRFFYPSLPCEDLIIPVDCRSAKGTLRASYPFRFFDRVIEDATIKVEGGRITSLESQYPGYVARYLNIDEEASRLSEVILCEELTRASRFKKAWGVPMLDRMRTSQVVFGGITPERITLGDESLLGAHGLNTSMARLEVPVGGHGLSVTGLDEDGNQVTIFKDGLFSC